jgi:beta-galactosidase beta subunit
MQWDADSCRDCEMNATDFNQLEKSEQRHFYKCKQCGQMVDMRQLDDVLFHEDHVHRPDIQYGGSEEL